MLGKGIDAAAQELAGFGAAKVLKADHDGLSNPLAEPYAKVIADAAKATGAGYVVAAATNQGKDILPRVAARLGAGLASDVVGLAGDGGNVLFKRPMWAGNAIATVEVATPVKIVTVRPTEVDEVAAGAASAVEAFAADPGAARPKYLKFNEVKSERPAHRGLHRRLRRPQHQGRLHGTSKPSPTSSARGRYLAHGRCGDLPAHVQARPRAASCPARGVQLRQRGGLFSQCS